MKKIKLETRKVLDVQWGNPVMPEDVKDYFFNYFNTVNDVWVEYDVGKSSDSILDKWLLDNTNVKEGEEILLKHWW